MAQIVINEFSQNYTFNIGASEYCTVALPITASWGPALTNISDNISTDSVADALEETQWLHFPATREGLEQFVATYRGPSTEYRLANDYSYQMAITLLTAGYDVLTCRLTPGDTASRGFNFEKAGTSGGQPIVRQLTVTAKYPGSFGNNILVTFIKQADTTYCTAIVYVKDSSGARSAVENLVFCMDPTNSTDVIPYIDEVESNYVVFTKPSDLDDTFMFNPGTEDPMSLINGSDYTVIPDGVWNDPEHTDNSIKNKVLALAQIRYTSPDPLGAGYPADSWTTMQYYTAINNLGSSASSSVSPARANLIYYREWLYTYAYFAYSCLEDKLNYAPNRVICPGWDDQDIQWINDSSEKMATPLAVVSPLHHKLMLTAYYSRCATAYLDIPKSCARKYVCDETNGGYAQKLAASTPATVLLENNGKLYATNSALFAPWAYYTLAGMGKSVLTSPSLIALLIERAQILNQAVQYEWALPTNRKHNLKIGKLEYKVPKKIMDVWQNNNSGVGVNALTQIPDLGTNIWGNSTLFNKPLATYQALANLSTRWLVNAVEDRAYRCGISITFQYNNNAAYDKFYAGMTPLLDTMQNVGAINDYYITMAADIDGLAQVNANTVIGKIYLVIPGVINDITIDLIALPPGTDLSQFGA